MRNGKELSNHELSKGSYHRWRGLIGEIGYRAWEEREIWRKLAVTFTIALAFGIVIGASLKPKEQEPTS